MKMERAFPPVLPRGYTVLRWSIQISFRQSSWSADLRLLHLKAVQHLLVGGAQLVEVVFRRDKDQVYQLTLRAREGYQPVSFRNRLSVLLNRGSTGEIDGTALLPVYLNTGRRRVNFHARVIFLQLLDQLISRLIKLAGINVGRGDDCAIGDSVLGNGLLRRNGDGVLVGNGLPVVGVRNVQS